MDDLEAQRHRLTILSAVKLALDHGMEVADEISYRPLAEAPARLVDLLGIDLDAAHAVLDVQLRRLAPDERERLALEITELSREVGSTAPHVDAVRGGELVVRLVPDYSSCGVRLADGEADLDVLGVSPELSGRLQRWNDSWEDSSWSESASALATFRVEGLTLAAALQAELGERACVVFDGRDVDLDE